MRRKTTRGLPDILIDDRLVLELKIEPKKTERDRLIGQCCEYSVEWVTCAIVIGMPEEKVDALRDLLDKKSLQYIDSHSTKSRTKTMKVAMTMMKTMKMKTRRTTTMRTTGHEPRYFGMFDILGFRELLDLIAVPSVVRQPNSFVRHGDGLLARQARVAARNRRRHSERITSKPELMPERLCGAQDRVGSRTSADVRGAASWFY
jgi:hypothetical protein